LTMKKRFFTVGLGLFAALVMAGIALATSGPAVDWQVVAGGGMPASGGAVTLNDTLGQPIVGASSGGDVALGAGYWVGLGYDETFCGLTTGVQNFNQTWPVQVEVETLGTIDCLRVTRVDGDHPQATGESELNGVGWGRYWTMTATDSLGAAATGFTLTLTLPHDALSNPRACRYTGGAGHGWDCDDGDDTTFTAVSVTRTGITELSDWAVGGEVGPTAVSLSSFSAASQVGWVGWWVGLLLVGGTATAVLWRRKW
jgi:hypothetical protein